MGRFSNTLFITVTKFENLLREDVHYGFTASGPSGMHYSNGWDSMADFYQEYPNAEALKAHVLGLDVFADFVPGESGSIVMSFPENDDTETMTDEAMRALCEANGVRIVQAEEEEIRGMWDWLDEDGNACDQSFNTEREAMQNAILALDLE